MTNKDKGQFLAEIKMIGLQKEFKGLVGENINPINLVKKADKILDTRKTSYNYAFIKCCEKNNITNIDNIYMELDKIWSESKKELSLLKVSLSAIIPGVAVSVFAPFISPFVIGGAVGAIGTYQSRISGKWEQYIQKTIDYAETLDG